ncbi:parallel beta-helix repeat (two copies) [Methanococcoides vulcani]|uniref:Parallel beta-helix repeat (Two copies) n=1 Tax=Methanococcoides vulcani TaxID=1353158 RepID=A0A1H9ZVH1_9EURY|nr:NosD domain-containing protein [Methanococcoides vulcani]SES84852.1 parallel beta-helix repeat (two copies) [Methanococcoides vulcani]
MRIKKNMMICFGMVLVLMTIGTATAGTITVNNSTGPVADYTSIQDAVDVATNGDTILVYPGTYVENVDVNKELTIIAESGPDVTTVQCVPGMDDYVFHAGNLTENVNVTINGFNVTGGRGIGFSESLHSELRNNIISDGGIFAGGSDITVINNTVISKGIILYDSEGILENNEVFSCSGTGITIEGQADGTLVNNTIYENGVGIRIWDFGSGDIYNNTIYRNEVGIKIYGNSYGKIANNYFNNTMNAQIDVPYLGIYITWNTTKTAGANIIGGPFLGGNYWAHPNGTGFSQIGEDLDGDGICDSPYIIDGNNTDYLPLYLPTPVDKMEALKEYVNGLDGEVADSTKHVLNVKLDGVIKNLDKGNNDNAIKKLENFIKFVDIKERQGKLGTEQAEYLINEANSIIEMIQNSEG